MDDIDAGIIRILGEDGRITNKKVAQSLGTSEATIAARIRALQAVNVIRIVAQRKTFVDPEASMLSIIEFYVENPEDIEIAGAVIAGFDEVLSAYRTSRRPEFCAYVRSSSTRDLNDLVMRLVDRMPPLSRINTLPVLDGHRTRATIVNLRHPAPHKQPPKDVGDALLAELETDGRQSVRALSRKLGLSETAIHHRLRRLLERHGMRIVLVADAEALGFQVWADLRMAIAPRHLAGAVEKLSRHPDITVIAHIAGDMNLTVFVAARTVEDLDIFVREHIRPLPGLIDFSILRVPQVVKYDYNFVF